MTGEREGQPLKIERGKGIYKVPVDRYAYRDPSTTESKEETRVGRIRDILGEKGRIIPDDTKMVVLHVKNPEADIRVVKGVIYARFEETELWSLIGYAGKKKKRTTPKKTSLGVEETQLELGSGFSKISRVPLERK